MVGWVQNLPGSGRRPLRRPWIKDFHYALKLFDFDCVRDYIIDMEVAIKFWECPQDAEHIYDFDDWRLDPNYWTGKVKCPKDHRPLELRTAKVTT